MNFYLENLILTQNVEATLHVHMLCVILNVITNFVSDLNLDYLLKYMSTHIDKKHDD